MKIIQCDFERHGEAIMGIFNEAIANTTALYEYKPRTMEYMTTWFAAKARGNYPVIGVTSDDGELTGFATYGQFRPHPAYKYIVEHSVYVNVLYRRRGLGQKLLLETISAAKRQDYHVLIGAIDAANTGSISLHEKLGFAACGTVRQAGFKFGRWLDLAFYQLVLPTPAKPVDG